MRWLVLGLFVVMAGCGDGGMGEATGADTSGGGTAGTTTANGGGGTAGGTTTNGGAGAAGGTTATMANGGSGGAGAAGGTGGSAGGATTGSGGGSSPSTSGSGGAGGAIAGGPCTWGEDCGAGLYCLTASCGAGTCTYKPIAAGLRPAPDPVCGCDGVTYWNDEVAASQGASIAAMGACSMPIVCGPDMPCPGNMKCSREVADSAACSPDASGECWGTALSCPLDGPSARACTTNTCELTCSLIQSQNAWFDDPTCN